MASVERRIGIVLDAKLDGLRRLSAGDLGDEHQSEVDSRRDAACRDDVPVPNDARLLVRGSDQRQQLRVSPMRRRALAAQQSSRAENEGANADRGNVFGT